ncbi:SMP-30/gluconolactonase/LRE family protein [Kutzneria sp. NPDC051319]|uniref:SMP-30/gluconolactonase/LRE family protein n=1 Tax=Kutzneria sp. NPDC051319 TaxID=3155047 RepID=UPI00341F24E3
MLVEPGPFPDGLCVDADGSFWVALFQGGRFVHVSAGGEVLEEIDTGGRIAVACAFEGGSLHRRDDHGRAARGSQPWIRGATFECLANLRQCVAAYVPPQPPMRSRPCPSN